MEHTEDQIIELFQKAMKETDLRNLFEEIELLIFLIKTIHEIEVPFTSESNGDIKLAYKLYLENKYSECVAELRKIKRRIIRSLRKG
ncbi:MAG: hypothetical protein ACP5LF_01975 [Nitrososphaeria archaeon]|nr:hypothetical protein [Conexivisphaerales archaeon]